MGKERPRGDWSALGDFKTKNGNPEVTYEPAGAGNLSRGGVGRAGPGGATKSQGSGGLQGGEGRCLGTRVSLMGAFCVTHGFGGANCTVRRAGFGLQHLNKTRKNRNGK